MAAVRKSRITDSAVIDCRRLTAEQRESFAFTDLQGSLSTGHASPASVDNSSEIVNLQGRIKNS
jgi:hypothetical protein